MATEIRVPTLGESIVEATVGRWLKKVGDSVSVGEPLVELETDKINMEVNAEAAGVLQQIDKDQGADVSIGDVLGSIGAANEAAAAAPVEPETQAAEAKTGENVQPPTDMPKEAVNAAMSQQDSKPADSGSDNGRSVASPVARRMADANNINVGQLQGSGPGGRVTKSDVAAQMSSGQQAAPAEPTAPHMPPAAPAKPASAQPAQQQAAAPSPFARPDASREQRVKLTRRRQTIAKRLVEAQHNAAMLTTFNEVDMTAVMDLRKRHGDAFLKRNNVKLGFMSFFVKAVIGALKFQPRLNAEIQGDEMILKQFYDIGIAVGAEEGLVVPVVRDADRKSFSQIEREIGELGKKARDGALGLSDLQGGSFTITNGGIFGSLMSTPILNAPQVGILGMHAIKERPIVVDGEIKIRPMMYLALSYDHRIVDGSEAVRFLVRVKDQIEDPETLLLEG